MFPEINPLAEPLEPANSFLTVLFRSVVPQRPNTPAEATGTYWCVIWRNICQGLFGK